MAVPHPLPLGSNMGPRPDHRVTRLVNWRAQARPRMKGASVLRQAPGCSLFAALAGATGGVRALADVAGELLVVAGRGLYSVTASGACTRLGGISGDGPLSVARNLAVPHQAVIAGGGLAYSVVQGAVTAITDPDLPPPVDVAEQSGYFVFLAADGRLTSSRLLSLDVDGADFAYADAQPDGGVAVASHNGQLWVFGEGSIQLYDDDPPPDGIGFPFTPAAGGFLPYGCLAASTLANVDGTLFWVDRDGAVRRQQGYDGVVVSPPGLEEHIAAESDPRELRAFSYSSRESKCYAIAGRQFCWVFDATLARTAGSEAAWHERETIGRDTWRVVAAARLGRRTIVGDRKTGTLYTLADAHTGDGGAAMICTVQDQVHTYPRRLTLHHLGVDVEPGTGRNNTATEETTPVMDLALSRDGGHTWEHEDPAPIGGEGERRTRCFWTQLGTSDEDGFVVRLTASASVCRAIWGASIAIGVER